MIDSKSYCYPEFCKIMQTCKTLITSSQENIIKKYFGEFYEEHPSKFIIDDAFMTNKHIRQDRGYLGDEINRVHYVESW